VGEHRPRRHNDPVELRQLHCFVVVAEQLHFGRAAEILHIGQPAVSQQVSRLERELGVPLLDRSPRLVRLTDAGRRLLPEARAVLAAAERVRDAAASSGRTRLRLGTSTGLGDHLDRVLDELGRLAPGIDVELVSASTQARLDRVRSGQLDAAFVRGLDDVRGLRVIPVWRDPLVAALPSAHHVDDEISLAALADLPLRIVSRRQNQALVDLVMSSCAAAGFEPVLGQPSVSMQDTLAVIGTGPRSWTVVYAAQARVLASSRVRFVRIVDPPMLMQTSLAVLPSGSVDLLMQACSAAAAGFDDHDR